MISELLTAGPVFWGAVILIALAIFGTTSEKLRRRKLEIDLQRHLNANV
jgi:hypothetical protein